MVKRAITIKGMKRREPTESEIQQQFVAWLDIKAQKDERYRCFFKVPNETRGNYGWLTKLKKEGLKKGVPDMLCIEPHGEFRGLALEFKRNQRCKLTDEQKTWMARFSGRRWLALIVYTAEQAMAITEHYMEWPALLRR